MCELLKLPNKFIIYSNKLEKAYRLCSHCDVKLQETLEKKRRLFKGFFAENKQKIMSTAIQMVSGIIC